VPRSPWCRRERAGTTGGNAIVAGAVQNRGVPVRGLPGGSRPPGRAGQHHRRGVLVEPLAGSAPAGLTCPQVARAEGLQALRGGEVPAQRPRVAHDHDNAIERAALPRVEDRANVAPIALTVLPWGGLNADRALAQALALWAPGPEQRAEDRTTVRSPLGLDLVGPPHRGALGTFDQAPFEVRFARIPLRGWRGGAAIRRPAPAPQGPPDRVAVNAPRPSKRSNRDALWLQGCHHDPWLLQDHPGSPPLWMERPGKVSPGVGAHDIGATGCT
jgi:hypothetical protein